MGVAMGAAVAGTASGDAGGAPGVGEAAEGTARRGGVGAGAGVASVAGLATGGDGPRPGGDERRARKKASDPTASKNTSADPHPR